MKNEKIVKETLRREIKKSLHKLFEGKYKDKGETKDIKKRKDGWVLLDDKTRKVIGGPYKTKEEALQQLRAIQVHKHK